MLRDDSSLDAVARVRARMQMLLDDLAGAEAATVGEQWSPPADIEVRDDAVVVTLEVPGLGREQLDVSVRGQTLTLAGERSRPSEEEGQVVRSERPVGSFRRSFALPWALDAEGVEARLERGVLRVTVPRAAGRSMPTEGSD